MEWTPNRGPQTIEMKLVERRRFLDPGFSGRVPEGLLPQNNSPSIGSDAREHFIETDGSPEWAGQLGKR